MKINLKEILFLLALGFASAACAQTNNIVVPRSDFVMPVNTSQGRDPFFPESARPYESATPAKHAIEITSLSVKGFSIVKGHEFVIINNHTFGIGEEGDVITTGGRIHLKCLEIRPDAVVIEVNGQRHQLNLSAQQ